MTVMTPKALALKHIKKKNAKRRDIVDVKCPSCSNTHKITFNTLVCHYVNDKEKYKCKFCNSKKHMSIAKKTALKCILEANQNPKLIDSITAVCATCHKNFTREFRHVIKCCANREGPYVCRTCSNREIQARPEVKKKRKKTVTSEAYKKTASARAIKTWKNPKYRTKLSAINKTIACTDAGRKQRSKQSKDAWKNEEYRRKITESAKLHYNKDMFTEEVRKKLSASTTRMWRDKEYRKKTEVVLYKNRIAQPRISSIQKALYSILDDLGVVYKEEFPLGYYAFDCFVPSYNILIECQGEYWHSLKENISRDKAKATYIERYFPQYQLKYLWEHEFYAKGRIINILKYWLKLNKSDLVDFNFNNVEVKKVKHSDIKLLLSKYHYLPNAGRGGIIYGAYFEDKPIACCVFSSPTRKETATRLGCDIKEIRELSRFCIHPSYQKKNFGSWFLSRCIKNLEHKYKLIVSFCDTTYNHDGALYKACNFELDGKTKPDYWYVDKDGYVMHKKTLYQRAIKMQMKEREYAEKNGYTKVWGKEKLRFTYGLVE